MRVRKFKKNPSMLRPGKKNTVAEKKDKTTPVKSINRATSILRCMSDSVHSIKDIAAHCGLSQATVHRILRTLEESEFIFQDPIDRKYYLGTIFTQLSLNQINTHKYLTAQSIDELLRLRDLFGEFTALDAEVGMRTIQLINIPSKFNYSITRINCPMFYGSHSKVLLAQHNDDEIEIILNSVTPRPSSKHCVTDKEQLREQFREARRQGFYICRKEIDEGIMGISVPVNTYVCPVSLSIVGPEIRLEAISAEVIKEMLISANRISDRISKNKSRPGPGTWH